MLGCHFHFNTSRQVSYIFASCENINKGKILRYHFHFNRSRQVLQTFVNYEDINKDNAVRGLLSRLHPRITHYNRIIIEYNG